MIKVGPHNTYPEHAHAADEGYHILAGKIFLIISYLEWRWQRNGVANMMRMLVILETMIKKQSLDLIIPSTGEAWMSKNDSGMVHRRAGTSKLFQNHLVQISLNFPIIIAP